MGEFLQLSLVVALVVAKNSSEESGEEMEKSEGLCMEPEEVVYWCTAGTPLGEKLMEAMSTSSSAEEQEEPAGRKKGGKKCKKGKKCKGKGKVRSAPVLMRWRPGSWRSTKLSCVCSLSLAGWTTLVTGARPLPRLTSPLSHPT